MAILFWIVFILIQGDVGCSKLRSELRHIQTRVHFIMVDISGFRRDLEDLTNSLNNTDNRIEELANGIGNCEVTGQVGETLKGEAETSTHDTRDSTVIVKQSKMFQSLEHKLNYVMNGMKNEKHATKNLIEQTQESLQILAGNVAALEEHSNTLSEAFKKQEDIERKDIEIMSDTIQELVKKFESLQMKCDERHISITEIINDFKEENKKGSIVLQQQIEANSNEIHQLNATLHEQVKDVGDEISDLDKIEKKNEIDCSAIKMSDATAKSGIYKVTLKDAGTLTVFCDMETDGGGWTVFQNRFDGSVDFYKTFGEYEHGFGDINGEFWLGLTHIHAMTKTVRSILRIDLEDATGNTAYETFDNFFLSDGPLYTLNIDRGVGTAGDIEGLSYNKGDPFSARDRNQGNRDCPKEDRGGWWYSNCAYANLNGEYVTPGTVSSFNGGEGGMTYREFARKKSLKKSKMMFRRV